MSEEIKILESAMSDVGFWSWWTGDFDNSIQIEFGGVQLWSPPLDPGKPPNGQIGLLFRKPTFVAFLTRHAGDDPAPANWPTMMANDELGNVGVDNEAFTLTDIDRLKSIVDGAEAVDIRAGDRQVLDTATAEDAFVGLWAGPVGIAIVAQSMSLVNHAGGIAPGQIARMHNQWWDYWKAYWKSKDTDSPMPRDYACEVTVPVGWG
jgi:hypothetical protein